MIVEYDEGGATPGAITHVVIIHQADFADHLRQKGATFVDTVEGSADSDLYYIVDGKLEPRPTVPIALSAETIKADGVAGATLSGIPAGWQIVIDGGAPIEADGSDIEISATLPHTYEIVASGPWPFASWRGFVICA